MDSFFWHKCWERNQLGFHQSDVHPVLPQYFKKLSLPSDQHVFLSLCGKTHATAYLAQYWQVTGNELSEIACSDFFLENNTEYQKRSQMILSGFLSSAFTITRGFFKLTADAIDRADGIYHRAALIALPTTMQQAYVKHLKTLFRSHTRFFLVTVKFPKAQLSGPPFSITATDVQSLFSGFTIECLATNKLKDKQFAQRSLEVDYLSEKLYIITKK